VTTEPRTNEDWEVVDDMVNSFLQEAGVPPRPRGYAWYLELPEPLMPRDVWSAIHTPNAPGSSAEPLHVRDAMVQAISQLYPSG